MSDNGAAAHVGSDIEEPGSMVDAVRGILEEAQQPETASAEASEIFGADIDLAGKLEAILAGGEPADAEPPETAGAQDEGAETQSDALTLDAVAERLGIETAALFSLPVPMPDSAETRTIGELKDMATQYMRHETERLEFDEEREKQRVAISNAREDVAAMLALVPEQFRTPEMLDQARSQVQKLREEQAEKLLTRVPEWSDDTRRTADENLIDEHLQPWGFGREGIFDANVLAYLRHNARREQQLQAALEQMRGGKSKGGKPQRQPKNKQARQSGGDGMFTSKRQETARSVGQILSENK